MAEPARTIDPDFLAGCLDDVREMYLYWAARLAGRRCPARADLDPVDIPHLLPGIILADVISTDPLDLRYRLVGTRETGFRGNDPTGKTVREAFYGCSLDSALYSYTKAVFEREPLFRCDSYIARNHRTVREERLFLPLSDDGETVNRVLVYVSDAPVSS